LVAAAGLVGLGSVSLRPLVVRPPVGLDVDRRPAVGLRAAAPRPLGAGEQPLGVGAGLCRARASGLGAGPGGLLRRRGLQRERLERRAGGLVAAGAVGGLRRVVS